MLKRPAWAKKMEEPRYGGRWHPIESSDLRQGDVVLVLANELIPCDGEVIEGVASVDESSIRDLATPVVRESGGWVTCGTRVLVGWILVRCCPGGPPRPGPESSSMSDIRPAAPRGKL